MSLRYLLEVRPPQRRPLVVVVQDRVQVGRDCDGIMVADAHLSRLHAEFIVANDATLGLVDHASLNGVAVNGTPVDGSQTVVDGDRVSLGDTEILVRAEPARASAAQDSAAQDSPTVTSDSSAGAVDGGATGPDVFYLRDEPEPVPAPQRSGVLRPTEAMDMVPGRSSIQALLASVESAGGVELRARGTDGTITLGLVAVADIDRLRARRSADEVDLITQQCCNIVTNACQRVGGRELYARDDAVLVVFPSVRRAVEWAATVHQGAHQAGSGSPESDFALQVGLHATPYDPGDTEVLLRAITTASVVAEAAGPSETLSSLEVRRMAEVSRRVRFGATRLIPKQRDDGLVEVSPVAMISGVGR